MVMIHFGATRKIYETIYKKWGLVNEYRVQYFYRSTVKVLPVFLSSMQFHELSSPR